MLRTIVIRVRDETCIIILCAGRIYDNAPKPNRRHRPTERIMFLFGVLPLPHRMRMLNRCIRIWRVRVNIIFLSPPARRSNGGKTGAWRRRDGFASRKSRDIAAAAARRSPETDIFSIFFFFFPHYPRSFRSVRIFSDDLHRYSCLLVSVIIVFCLYFFFFFSPRITRHRLSYECRCIRIR